MEGSNNKPNRPLRFYAARVAGVFAYISLFITAWKDNGSIIYYHMLIWIIITLYLSSKHWDDKLE